EPLDEPQQGRVLRPQFRRSRLARDLQVRVWRGSVLPLCASVSEGRQARVAGNSVDPRRQRSAAVEGGQGAPDFDEYLLSHVLRRLPVAHEAVGQPEDLPPVGAQNLCERLVTAIRADELDDFAVRQHLDSVFAPTVYTRPGVWRFQP